jgi:hypothetical protein
MEHMKLFIALMLMALLAGCGKSNDQAGNTNSGYSSPIKGTAAGKTVEDMTGYTDVKLGQMAKEKIKAVSTQERQDYNDAANANKPPQ